MGRRRISIGNPHGQQRSTDSRLYNDLIASESNTFCRASYLATISKSPFESDMRLLTLVHMSCVYSDVDVNSAGRRGQIKVGGRLESRESRLPLNAGESKFWPQHC